MQGAYYCTRGHADDMILLAQTSHDMQCMLDICQAEIEALDLQFNVCCYACWSPLECFLCAVCSWISYVEILWQYKISWRDLKAGKKLSCTYDHLKLKFYSSFNALYSRSKSSNSELVSVIVKSFCLPALLYDIEVSDPSWSTTKQYKYSDKRWYKWSWNGNDKADSTYSHPSVLKT